MDLLIRGGTLVTMDPNRRVFQGDLLVRGGRIVGVGKIIRDRPARLIDARGCAVLPGLVQAHVHLCQTLFRGMADDLPLLRWLKTRIWPLEAAHDRASLRASADLGLAEMIAGGTTTILDMGTVHHHDVVFQAMRRSGIRGFSGKAMMDRGKGVPAGLRENTRESLRESAQLCERWHGAEDGRLGYAFAPRFILSCSPRLLKETARLARESGALLHSHAAEHADERRAVKAELGIDDIEALARSGLSGEDTILAHGVQLRDGEMKKMARAGTRIVHCPSANLKLASGIAHVPRMQAAGLVVGLGSDGAPCNNRHDGFTELRQAALLAKAKTDDAAALSAMDALALGTIDGAKALGIDDEVGSLEVGKKADVAVVGLGDLHSEPGGDAVGRLVYSASPADVRHVLVDGRLLLKDRVLQTIDREATLKAAKTQGRRLQRRAGI